MPQPTPQPALRPWWTLRAARVADAPIVAAQRAAIFLATGALRPEGRDALERAAAAWLAEALAAGEYAGWLLAPRAAPGQVVAGAGVQLRRQVPRPAADGVGVLAAPQGLVMNVWTEPAWRRRGAAEALVRHVVAWAPVAGLGSLVLHASADARPLYEKLGFAATGELRFGPLAP